MSANLNVWKTHLNHDFVKETNKNRSSFKIVSTLFYDVTVLGFKQPIKIATIISCATTIRLMSQNNRGSILFAPHFRYFLKYFDRFPTPVFVSLSHLPQLLHNRSATFFQQPWIMLIFDHWSFSFSLAWSQEIWYVCLFTNVYILIPSLEMFNRGVRRHCQQRSSY